MSHQQRSLRVRRITALVAVGAIGLAACGGEDEPSVAVAAPAVETPPKRPLIPESRLHPSVWCRPRRHSN